MPTLALIAGPNGAGKSTISKILFSSLKIEAFDFDKEFYQLWSNFGYDPALVAGVNQSTITKFSELKLNAIREGANFAFETNYHHPSVLTTLQQFRLADYELQMFFITLPNVETAIERVRERVSKGGHSVDTNTIQERFDAGLQQLDNTFASFDYLRIFESSHRSLSTNAIIDMKAPGLEIRKPFSNSTAGKIPKLVAYIEQQSGNL